MASEPVTFVLFADEELAAMIKLLEKEQRDLANNQKQNKVAEKDHVYSERIEKIGVIIAKLKRMNNG